MPDYARPADSKPPLFTEPEPPAKPTSRVHVDLTCGNCGRRFGADLRMGDEIPPCPACQWKPAAKGPDGNPARSIAEMAVERALKKVAKGQEPAKPATAEPTQKVSALTTESQNQTPPLTPDTTPEQPPAAAHWFKPGTCRSCGAPIWWSPTDKGKDAPLDRKPVTVMFVDTHTQVVWARRAFVNHFATCPSAAQHKKP